MRTGRTLLSVVLIATISTPAQAMRCGRELISIGDRSVEVRRHCGQPIDIIQREEQVRYGVQDPITGAYVEKVRTEIVAEWTYNLGPRRFMRLLRFSNGRVVDIRSLDYGY